MLFNRQISTTILFAIAILLSDCATTNDGTRLDSSTVRIERQRSHVASIGHVSVYQQKHGSLIRGEIRRNHSGRGVIPGHVDIELLNAEGKTAYKDRHNYSRSGLRGRSASFILKLKQTIKKGSRLRITHHDSAHGFTMP